MLSPRWGLIGVVVVMLLVALAVADYDTVGKHVDDPVRGPSALMRPFVLIA